jgi:hypothetical protein
MSSFNSIVFFIVIIIIIFLLFAIRAVWDIYATSVTLRLLQNNSGGYSTKKIIVGVCVIIAIALLLQFFAKRQATASRTKQ